MLTEMQRRQRAIDLAARVPAFLARRLDQVEARERAGQASERQVLDARAACASSRRALRNLKRRTRRTA